MEVLTWQFDIVTFVGASVILLVSLISYFAFAIWTSDSLQDLYHFAKGGRREGSSIKGNVKIVAKSLALICTSFIVARFCFDLFVAYTLSASGV